MLNVMPKQMSTERTNSGRIGDWLWHGGRLRVLEVITTNGGKVFEVGEIIRLVQLTHYGYKNQLAEAHYVSETDPAKGYVMSGWGPADDCRFALVTR